MSFRLKYDVVFAYSSVLRTGVTIKLLIYFLYILKPFWLSAARFERRFFYSWHFSISKILFPDQLHKFKNPIKILRNQNIFVFKGFHSSRYGVD